MNSKKDNKFNCISEFKYVWLNPASYVDNKNIFFNEFTATKIAEFFLKHGDIYWIDEENGMGNFTTETILTELIVWRKKEIGHEMWVSVIEMGIKNKHITYYFYKARLGIILDALENKDFLIEFMKLMEPIIPSSDIYSTSNISELENNNVIFPLIYFSTMNNKITKRKAEQIFEDFDPDGQTFLGLDTQNFLINNNKHIRKIISDNDLWGDYPTPEIRDIFIF